MKIDKVNFDIVTKSLVILILYVITQRVIARYEAISNYASVNENPKHEIASSLAMTHRVILHCSIIHKH